MKKIYLFRNKYLAFLVLAILQFFLSGNRKHQKNNPSQHLENRYWSGTITMEQSMSGILGTSERHVTVSFNNALPTLHRDSETTETDFTDNKGTGSETFEGETIIEGKKVGRSSCSGSGKTELHIVDIDGDGNYYIHAIGPRCTGTAENFITHEISEIEPYTTDITISDRVIGRGDFLSGTDTKVAYIPDEPNKIATVTTTITWHLTKSTANDVELIVTPDDYDRWLPEPGKDELQVGSVMNILLKLQKRGGGTTTKKAKAFELHLSNTSKEPGITINFPVETLPDPMFDLRFEKQTNGVVAPDFQTLHISCPGGCQTANAKIGSYDGGGWTVLTVEAILQDNSRIQGRLLVSGGELDIRIPKRDPNSKIGEAWLNQYGNPGEMDDKETSLGNTNNGDGLTAYEEYRGVISQDTFKRLDPIKKELGIKVSKSDKVWVSLGLKWFESASMLKLILFNTNEIPDDRRFNRNGHTAHNYDQFVLYIKRGNLRLQNWMGYCYGIYGQPDIPARVEKIVIDIFSTSKAYQEWNNVQRLPFSVEEKIANVVAHELGHGVNIKHHGDLPEYVSPQTASSSWARVFASNGFEIGLRPYTITGGIGPVSGLQSGDLSCVMAYNPFYSWAYIRSPNQQNFYSEVPAIQIGKGFCTSSKGTGINAPPANIYDFNKFFGDATNGNCISQIKLKD